MDAPRMGLRYSAALQPGARTMTSLDPPQSQPMTPQTRSALKVAGAGFGLLALAAGLFWLRFGSDIYFDMIAFAQGCF